MRDLAGNAVVEVRHSNELAMTSPGLGRWAGRQLGGGGPVGGAVAVGFAAGFAVGFAVGWPGSAGGGGGLAVEELAHGLAQWLHPGLGGSPGLDEAAGDDWLDDLQVSLDLWLGSAWPDHDPGPA